MYTPRLCCQLSHHVHQLAQSAVRVLSGPGVINLHCLTDVSAQL